MIYLDEKESLDIYTEAVSDANSWREDYPEYERLMNNGLLEDLDDSLPEVNDGSLAAALFKLPKRIVNNKLSGEIKALDRDEAWLSELANLQWRNKIIPNANVMAPFHSKWKDAVRKSAGYGSVPLVTIFRDDGYYRGADFIVAQPLGVKLEPGKVSDKDSDIIFWDVYYTRLQLKNMIEEAKAENKAAKAEDRESYNKWNVKELEELLKGDNQEQRSSQEFYPAATEDKSVKKSGYKFTIAFQRGVNAPFRMLHPSTKKCVREWSNPDPTGDIPVHYLYCYQDFVNPYGIGMCKLAGGTQNVLDFMRKQDVLATAIGVKPPLAISGDDSNVDIDSVVWQQDAMWFLGNAQVQKQDIASGVYNQLPDRINMYKTSLNQTLPQGDTTIGAGSGDPNASKTPAGVKFAASNLSIDDEDFKDKLYDAYAAVGRSMINTHFANMEGSDLMKLTDEERDLLQQAGLEFPLDEEGKPSNQLDIIWDNARATFDFKVDPESDKTKDDEVKLEGLRAVMESIADPMALQTIQQAMMQAGKKLDVGEAYAEYFSLLTDNEKIVVDVTPEETEANEQQQMMQQMQPELDPTTGQPLDTQASGVEQMPEEMPPEAEMVEQPIEPETPETLLPEEAYDPELNGFESNGDEEQSINIKAVMDEYNVDEPTAIQMLAAEEDGFSVEEILAYIQGGQDE